MPRISKSDVYAALDRAAEHMLSAAEGDMTITRRGIRSKLRTLSGVEKALVDIFYRFMDHRTPNTEGIITSADIEGAIRYAKEKMIDKYDLNRIGLSKKEIEEMSTTGKLAVALARQLKRASATWPTLEPEALAKYLGEISEGLFFTSYANEGDSTYKAFYRKAELIELTAEAFAQVMNLDQNNPEEIVWIINDADDFFQEEAHMFDIEGFYNEDFVQHRDLAEVMQGRLHDIKVIVIGEDSFDVNPQHPVYIVGIAEDGSLVGLETHTIWT